MSLDWSIVRCEDVDTLVQEFDAYWEGREHSPSFGNCPTGCTSEIHSPSDERDRMVHEGFITECLIWATMGIGMRSITESNWQDFYIRVKMWESIIGAFGSTWQNNERVPLSITAENIRRRIGLGTNASTFTMNEYVKHLRERVLENEMATV